MRAIPMLACVGALFGAMALSAAQNAPSANPRHVWTNDNLEGLRDKAPVSVVGAPPADATGGASGADADAAKERRHKQRAERYRSQLQPLYAERSRIESEIAEMHRWQNGSYRMTGMWPLRFAGMPLNPADRIAQLEAQDGEVRERIGNLEDEARHAGVLPGELR